MRGWLAARSDEGAVSNGMKGNSCCCCMRCWEEMPTTSALAKVGLGGRWCQRRGSDIIFGGGIGDVTLLCAGGEEGSNNNVKATRLQAADKGSSSIGKGGGDGKGGVARTCLRGPKAS
ncbi:hypothetical protein B296_00036567 [Ensete ventricosum]|uniref:Uncharacterized protein n=1 Tax=Ensete ventricosum TaxID=4639 RepID=A0A426Z9S8_ENSVE|nr:hypothetical protein B296_00036567 [Ensete ventricosum]